MKRRLIVAAFAAISLLILTSCKAEKPAETPNTPPAVESPQPTVTPAAPQAAQKPSNESKPPYMPEEERKHLNVPCLVKLKPHLNGSYTDGANTFYFEDDGTVLWNTSNDKYVERIHTFEKKDIEKSIDLAALKETDEYLFACGRAMDYLGSGFPGPDYMYIAHKDGDTWYLYFDYPTGGGSGESYWIKDKTIFVKVLPTGEVEDYGDLRAGHIVWYENWFYYVELESGVLGTPGIGRVKRVDMNGKNRETVVDEPVYGTIQVLNGRVYYTNLTDGLAYSVELDGSDKTQVSEKIIPQYNRVGLEFYGDVIISRYWNASGYSYGMFSLPNDYSTAPAIMDANGENLITFPLELYDDYEPYTFIKMGGSDTYEVINWGGDEEYNNPDSYGGVYFLFLRSTLDGSYWAYEFLGNSNWNVDAFDFAREQWAGARYS